MVFGVLRLGLILAFLPISATSSALAQAIGPEPRNAPGGGLEKFGIKPLEICTPNGSCNTYSDREIVSGPRGPFRAKSSGKWLACSNIDAFLEASYKTSRRLCQVIKGNTIIVDVPVSVSTIIRAIDPREVLATEQPHAIVSGSWRCPPRQCLAERKARRDEWANPAWLDRASATCRAADLGGTVGYYSPQLDDERTVASMEVVCVLKGITPNAPRDKEEMSASDKRLLARRGDLINQRDHLQQQMNLEFGRYRATKVSENDKNSACTTQLATDIALSLLNKIAEEYLAATRLKRELSGAQRMESLLNILANHPSNEATVGGRFFNCRAKVTEAYIDSYNRVRAMAATLKNVETELEAINQTVKGRNSNDPFRR
jgi:hypothetical protein